MRVSIFTEGGKTIGFGHITRCMALYQGFKENGLTPEMIIAGDESIEELVEGINHRLFNWLDDDKGAARILEISDIAVIDSYLADIGFYRQVSGLAKLGLYIDDNKRLDYPKGIIVNGSIYAKDLNYLKDNGNAYLLGTGYALLRKEFWSVPEKAIKETLQTVMITMGGSDKHNVTGRVLEVLVEHFRQLAKKVIIGKGFGYIEEVKKIADKNTVFVYSPDAAGMRQMMQEADVAISAGGQTLYELARVGLPALAICLADNQRLNIQGWQKEGFIRFIEGDLKNGILDGIKELLPLNERLNRSQLGRKLIDGKGTMNLIKEVLHAS